ncbi:MAG: hypothetical protein CVU39_14265 [Chloroflexi bacterium HGW-Chloroflexi-10]|nr:MAG: hypothetical protein CVU39_14265 [Chloroflexi bacterium HGW-Chloroflexi-10]
MKTKSVILVIIGILLTSCAQEVEVPTSVPIKVQSTEAPMTPTPVFKLDEFARKSVVVLLFVCVSVNLYLLVRLLFRKDGAVSSGLYFLDKEIHRFANPYDPKIFLAASIIVALLTIAFLSQRETKKLFMPATSSESNGAVEPL